MLVYQESILLTFILACGRLRLLGILKTWICIVSIIFILESLNSGKGLLMGGRGGWEGGEGGREGRVGGRGGWEGGRERGEGGRECMYIAPCTAIHEVNLLNFIIFMLSKLIHCSMLSVVPLYCAHVL